MTQPIPQRIGKYIIESTLGQGAMGVVYKGLDPHIERVVAIKVIRTAAFDEDELAGALVRFQREAQAAGRLMHPNVVTVYEYGEEGEAAYIAMEYVEGRTFKEIFADSKRLDLAEIVDLFRQLLLGLGYAHEFGVIHRDIKPANIVLNERGQVKIMDFGIARVESSSLTMAGTVVGTPAYMAPELISGEPIDQRCDLFAAGVILYQLLTGEKPFAGDSMTAIMHKVVNMEPVAPSILVAGLPPQLDEIIAKALAKDPASRFQTALEFSNALGEIVLGGNGVAPEDGHDTDATVCLTGSAEPGTQVIKQGVQLTSGRFVGVVALGLIVALCVFWGWFWWQGRDAEPVPSVQPPVDIIEKPQAEEVTVEDVEELPVEQPVVQPAEQPVGHDINLPVQTSEIVVTAPPVEGETFPPVLEESGSHVTFMPDSMVPKDNTAPVVHPVEETSPSPVEDPKLGSALPGTAPFEQGEGVSPGRLLREDEW